MSCRTAGQEEVHCDTDPSKIGCFLAEQEFPCIGFTIVIIGKKKGCPLKGEGFEKTQGLILAHKHTQISRSVI